LGLDHPCGSRGEDADREGDGTYLAVAGRGGEEGQEVREVEIDVDPVLLVTGNRCDYLSRDGLEPNPRQLR
jgi:hypothetical protein